MKAILEFELPEDNTEFELAIKGSEWYNVCWEMDQWLRGVTKYAPDSISKDTYNAYQECRDMLRGFIDDNGLDLHL